jgi:hypothetical protein
VIAAGTSASIEQLVAALVAAIVPVLVAFIERWTKAHGAGSAAPPGEPYVH